MQDLESKRYSMPCVLDAILLVESKASNYAELHVQMLSLHELHFKFSIFLHWNKSL